MKNTDSIKKEFLDIYNFLSNFTQEDVLCGNNEELCLKFDRLNNLAAMDINDHEAEKIRFDPEFQQIIKHISELKRVNGLRLEIENARCVINASKPWDVIKQFVYFPNYLELARMEYKGGSLRPGDRVVFLGSGPLPLSLISLCRQYGIKGIGIEQSSEYAALSQELIEVLKLKEHIHIIQGNHFSLPLEQDCQLIMIGADALPKNEIFNYLAEVLPENSRLSYRIYEKGLRRLLDIQSFFELPPEFKEYRRIRPEPPVNNTSVFILKNNPGK